MTMRDLFEAQLRNTEPTDGRFLQTVTREQMLKSFETLKRGDPVTYANPEALLEQKIQEYKEHVGEKIVYFLGYHEPGKFGIHDHSRVTLLRAWESEIDGLTAQWDIANPPMVEDSTLPRLVEKKKL